MTQPSLDALFTVPSAVQARRYGHRIGREKGPTLRALYVALLKADPEGLTDHQAALVLGVLSTTVGARRKELMHADPTCIEAVGRVKAGAASRTRWKWNARVA